jgi:glucose/arabinose dehydrogenase
MYLFIPDLHINPRRTNKPGFYKKPGLFVRGFASSIFFAALLVAQLAQAQSPAPNAPPGFAVSTLVSLRDGLYQPTAFAFLPDGVNRILIAEKSGLLKLFAKGVVYGRPVLDLRVEVNEFVDRGLVGLAVDPNYMQNGYIYLAYVYDAPDQTPDSEEPRNGRIVRYTMERTTVGWGNVARKNSAVVLLDDFKSDTQNHAVGTLRFASDGLTPVLFASFGDGALSAVPSELSLRAQSLDNVQGKLLRINTDGTGVKTNPFYDSANPRSARSRIWAYGFRNPFRFGLQPGTNTPYVGDVGWNTYETLSRANAGDNFGWPCVEGPQARPEFQSNPICKSLKTVARYQEAYTHDGNNASITGGAFVVGQNFPEAMRGNFIFGDYSKQFLRRAVVNAQGKVTNIETFSRGMSDGGAIGEAVDIQFGPDGALYVLSIYSHGLERYSYTANEAAVKLPPLVAAPAFTRPRISINSPADGDTVLANQVIQLSGSAGVPESNQTWQVTLHEKALRAVLTTTTGSKASFSMPAGLRDSAFVEAIYSARNASGEVSAQRIRLYPATSDGYVRSWWLIGGFPERVLADGAVSELSYLNPMFDPHAQVIRSQTGRVDFKDYLTPQDHTLAYAFVWIEVPEDRSGLLGMSSDDGVAVWVNGREVWRNAISRYVPKLDEPDGLKDTDLPPITLRKGRNALLVKIDQNLGDWVFKLRVLNADGTLMRDAVAKLGSS